VTQDAVVKFKLACPVVSHVLDNLCDLLLLEGLKGLGFWLVVHGGIVSAF